MENTATKSRVNKSSVASDLVKQRIRSVAALRAPFPRNPVAGGMGTLRTQQEIIPQMKNLMNPKQRPQPKTAGRGQNDDGKERNKA